MNDAAFEKAKATLIAQINDLDVRNLGITLDRIEANIALKPEAHPLATKRQLAEDVAETVKFGIADYLGRQP